MALYIIRVFRVNPLTRRPALISETFEEHTPEGARDRGYQLAGFFNDDGVYYYEVRKSRRALP